MACISLRILPLLRAEETQIAHNKYVIQAEVWITYVFVEMLLIGLGAAMLSVSCFRGLPPVLV